MRCKQRVDDGRDDGSHRHILPRIALDWLCPSGSMGCTMGTPSEGFFLYCFRWLGGKNGRLISLYYGAPGKTMGVPLIVMVVVVVVVLDLRVVLWPLVPPSTCYLVCGEKGIPVCLFFRGRPLLIVLGKVIQRDQASRTRDGF